MSDRPKIMKRRPGQPRKLYADEKTLNQIKAAASMMATTREIASLLLVSHQTFITFCNEFPVVKEMIEDGKEHGRLSLRRKQFKLADTHAGMAIFLGKNYLEQSDRTELTGKDGGPLQVRTLADFYGGLSPKRTDKPEGDEGA